MYTKTTKKTILAPTIPSATVVSATGSILAAPVVDKADDIAKLISAIIVEGSIDVTA